MTQLNENLELEANSAEENKKYAEIAADLTDLKNKLSHRVAYIKDALPRIVSDMERLKDNKSNFHVGKESVQPLVDLNAAAREIFNKVRDNDPSKQDIDFEPFVQHLNELKKRNCEIRQCINNMQLISDGITEIVEAQKKLKTNGNGSESCSSLSIAGSETSISEFSLFEGGNTNAATSSPISNTKNHEQ